METKVCQNCKNNFTLDAQDLGFYEKMQVPAPTFCPHCRMLRRFMFRSEHYLTRHKDEITGKEIFAGVPVQSPYKVYSHDYWWSDEWSALKYGREYDFSRPFFAQFKELVEAVPWCAKTVIGMVNSDYCDQASYCKNTYLSFDADYLEDCGYLVTSNYCKDSYDLLGSDNNELCYEGSVVKNCYRTIFSDNCEDCREVWFSRDCVGCSDCIGCANLKNKKHYIFNQPYTKEEYSAKRLELNLGSFVSVQKLLEELKEFSKRFPVKYMHGLRTTASSGDYVHNTKNARQCFLVQDAENVRFLQLVSRKCSDSYDYTVWGDGASQLYECLTCGLQADSLKFCFDCWPSVQNLEYCVSCRSSHDLFGCVGLRNKEYCIFNKQYSKEEYGVLKDKIIAQMKETPYEDTYGNTYAYGEFFPPELSAFSYNQTIAQDLFPLTKEQAFAQKYPWRDPDQKEYQTTLSAEQLPDHIEDVSDSVLKEIIQCSSCRRAYRIIEPEFNFYKRIGSPLPRECSDCRLRRRFSSLNQPVLYPRVCGCAGTQTNADFTRTNTETSPRPSVKYVNTCEHFHGAGLCPNKFETSYSPDRPEIVYCEACYNAEVS